MAWSNLPSSALHLVAKTEQFCAPSEALNSHHVALNHKNSYLCDAHLDLNNKTNPIRNKEWRGPKEGERKGGGGGKGRGQHQRDHKSTGNWPTKTSLDMDERGGTCAL